MSISKIALAIPLALGIGCSTTGSQSSDHTGAMWTQRIPSDGSMAGDPPPRGAESIVTPAASASSAQAGLSVQPTSGSPDGALAANDPSTSSGSTGSSGSPGSSDSPGGAVSPGSAGASDSTGPSGSSGGAMGSGGSSETMGTEHQGSGGSADHAQQGSASGPGSTGAHEGDQMLNGKLSKVSKDEISITAKGGEAKTLKIKPETVVTINGKDAKPTQLKKGQSVRASYENVSGDDVAVKIEVGKMRQGKHSGMQKHHGGASGGAGGSDSSSGGSMGGGSGGSDTGGSR